MKHRIEEPGQIAAATAVKRHDEPTPSRRMRGPVTRWPAIQVGGGTELGTNAIFYDPIDDDACDEQTEADQETKCMTSIRGLKERLAIVDR